MVKAVTAKEAKKIYEANGWGYAGAGDDRTFYATTEDETNCYEFDSKAERDEFVKKHNKEEKTK